MRGEDRNYVDARAREALANALKDDTLNAAMRDMAIDSMTDRLVRGRIPPEMFTVFQILEAREGAAYASVAVALGRQHGEGALATSVAVETARRIRAGQEPFEEASERNNPFGLLFRTAALQYEREIENQYERFLSHPHPVYYKAVRLAAEKEGIPLSIPA